MTDANQIRINELARQLEVKARAIIELLPGFGVTEKKTHSSAIDIDVAEKVRKRLQEDAEAEVAAEKAAAQKKADAEAAAKAARQRPAAPPPPPVVPIAAKPPAATAPAEAATAAVPPRIPPKAPAPAPAATPASAAGSPTKSPLPTLPTPRPPAAPPPAAARPSSPAATPSTPAAKVPPRAPAPSQPTAARPAANQPLVSRQPSGRQGSPSSGPAAQRRGAPPPRPGSTPHRHPTSSEGRPGLQKLPRPTGTYRPPSASPSAPPKLDKLPTKAEPGKPIYARKPAPRARPSVDKRFEEGERKLHPVRARPGVSARRGVPVAPAPPPIPREPRDVTITEGVTVRELAEKLDVRAKDLLKDLLDRGIFASINQALDIQTATTLAESFSGVVKVVTFEEEVVQEVAREEKPESLKPRPPVVTVMGHVDHGKTSLLDAMRETEVAAGEAGGITQHIGASTVTVGDRRIIFIDTPGHEAFTRMRARGARITDIVVLVVGADDGVMPQTLEAMDHAKAAGVPIVVAVNKIDKPEAQPERVKRQLSERGLMPEEWGGDTVMVEVSAKQKKNLDKLLEMILLVGDLRELKANPDAPAAGTVLESRIDRGRGPVATVLVQSGTLNVGDVFICGAVYGKVRALFDDRGQAVKAAGPSTPVEVLGLQGVPQAGDQFQVADEAKARHIVEYRQSKLREASLARTSTARVTLDQLHEQLKAGEVKELPIVIKADVQGSVEVLSEMLPKLSTDDVKLKIIHASVGAVAETDVLLASASNAIIIAFNVRPDRKATDLAQQENVDIRTHSIIYEVSDEMKKALAGLLSPVFKESILGHAEIRDTFRIKGVGMIAGSYVQDGLIKRDAEVRVLREGVVIYTGRVASLRRFKEDVGEVRNGFECGIVVSNFADVKVGDVLEVFAIQKVAAVAS